MREHGMTNLVIVGGNPNQRTELRPLFEAAGMILLVAMIGAIVLTHRVREGVRRQSIAAQVGRRRADAVEMKKVPTGAGLGGN